ncbi:MAG: CDP-diacylglycerol--glycerol-3-phosphate 3-phosphatidyltransferase [Bacilli bacterium]
MKVNLATSFTILRLILVPIIIFVLLTNIISTSVSINGQYIEIKYFIAAIIFVVGSLTDFVDGFIARKYNQVTDLGKFLDPIADKLLVNSTVIVLIYSGLISPIVGIIFIGRDTIVDVIRMIVSAKGEVVAASKYGKLKTVFQMVGITMVLLYNIPFENFGIPVATILIYIAVFFSVFSGIDYYYLNKKYIFEEIK